MEVILTSLCAALLRSSILHVCGGDPCIRVWTRAMLEYSPRMWRWSYCYPHGIDWVKVFSTYVEVILRAMDSISIPTGILHVCGGDPNSGVVGYTGIEYSPRMWRWSRVFTWSHRNFSVFSTYVEVILAFLRRVQALGSILHVCGGDPSFCSKSRNASAYSPRMWRWSFLEGP